VAEVFLVGKAGEARCGVFAGAGEAVAPAEADFRRTRMAGGIKSQSGNSFAKGDTF